ncbi:DUF4173 domain-containing protein [Flavobacterium sp. W1B]|uniref:DUF4153 domain-containing protein n=1 Tax=Flavobacterium sp. W1B TaxID=3394146 RepID=UPI0039BD405E
MKKHHLILVSSLVFTLLFYKETVGLNLAIFGLVVLGLIAYNSESIINDTTNKLLFTTSFVSCLAFAWYGDFVSFLALFLSLVFLQFRVQNKELKIVQSIPLVFINGMASVIRIFVFSQWLPEKKLNSNWAKIVIAYVLIPVVFLSLFTVVYSFGSNHFSSFFTDYTLDIDLFPLLLISILGFYLSFTFWNYWVPDICVEANLRLQNDFSENEKNGLNRTFSFLEIDFERKSGEITLLLLNVLLLVFIVTYNYEQFFEEVQLSKLSSATHERVNAVIFSIIMAVGVLLFYFKNGFNFDQKAQNLKRLAKVWILLNALLILSTIIKNTEYVSYYGLTYKRLGVFAFLVLASVGLFYSFLKIAKQKTNAYLFNQMLWYFYALILLCSYVNWGNLITKYNLAVRKGNEKAFLEELNFNDTLFYGLYPEELQKVEPKNSKADELFEYKNADFLSKVLYYETVDLK